MNVKKKLKRDFNFDAETKVLDSFCVMKKKPYKNTIGNNMNESKKKRIERKKKLKRVFNFDAETKFLDSFWDMKKRSLSIDEFNDLVKKILVDTEQVSDVVLEYYISELRTKEKIKEKSNKLDKLQNEIDTIRNEIHILEDSLIEEKDSELGYDSGDPCNVTRFKSSC